MREGWEIKTLGDIGKVSMCKRILKKQTLPIGDIPFYKIGTFGKIPNAFISKEVHEEYLSKYSFPKKGDILLSASGTIGRRVIYDGKPAYFQDSNIVWIANDEKKVLNEYLYEFYGFCDWNPSRGATISRLYNDDLRRIQVPIPPLPEQKEIVVLLDQAFAAIDQAKANIERNIENAKELFQSKLNAIFSQRGGGWGEKKLNQFCEVKDGTHDSPKYVDEQNGVPFVTQKNILEKGLSFEKAKFISQEDHNGFYRRSNVALNDILFAMIGANRGMACIVDDKRIFSIKNVGLIKSNDSYRGQYLLYFLKSPVAKKYVLNNSSGSAQGFIGLGKLREFPIPFTSLEKQKEIEIQLDSLNFNLRNAESKYNSKLKYLEELKKSILQKAFSGELTKQPVVVNEK